MNTTNKPIRDLIADYIRSKYFGLYYSVDKVESVTDKNVRDEHIYIHYLRPFSRVNVGNPVCLLIVVYGDGRIGAVSRCGDKNKYNTLEDVYKVIDNTYNYLTKIFAGYEDVLKQPGIYIDSYYPTPQISYKMDRLDERVILGMFDAEGQHKFVGGSLQIAYKMVQAMNDLINTLELDGKYLRLHRTANSLHIRLDKYDIYVSYEGRYHIYKTNPENGLPLEILTTDEAEIVKRFI